VTKIFCLLNNKKNNVVYAETENGNVKLSIPTDSVNDNIIIEINRINDVTLSVPGIRLKNYPVINLVAKNGTGTDITDSVVLLKQLSLCLPYPDKNNDGVVDGTTYDEQNLKICRFEDMAWELVNTQQPANGDENTVTADINKLGKFTIVYLGNEPTIENMVVYPNPFTDTVTFAFNIGSQAEVTLHVYTVTGRLVKTITRLVAQTEVGYIKLVYDGTDKTGDQISNGTYLYKIITQNGPKQHTKTGKLTKVK
jgi:hypothetical protein